MSPLIVETDVHTRRHTHIHELSSAPNPVLTLVSVRVKMAVYLEKKACAHQEEFQRWG